jgi:signal transduction histidine kinase
MRDITGRKQDEERIKHLNRVLMAIRDVNQLIDRERDPDTLIGEGCRLLVENRGYASALIVLTDQNDRPVSWAQAGMEAAFGLIADMLAKGQLPPCCDRSRSTRKVVLIEDREIACGGCPQSVDCSESLSLCVHLSHDGVGYGYLVAAVEQRIAVDDEEQNLFAEMADDLAYALSVTQMDKARVASEQKRILLENQLLQAQKMESVGRLAGGVAHDFNNMLGAIMGYSELAMHTMDSSDPIRKHFGKILDAAQRSANLTRQLLAFARKQTVEPVVFDLNASVEGTLKMLRRLIGENIDLAWLPATGKCTVRMDPSQLDQILTNLCVNARDAIADVGKVTIKTDTADFDEIACGGYADGVPGEYVLLSVGDNGCGMDQKTQDHIFEPFFTTKGVRHGTGLGLATVYGIVKQNHGFIQLDSKPGIGTTFTIYLPRHAGGAETATEDSDNAIPHSQGETILMVEDDPTMREMGLLMLQRLGYTVLSAATPGEAIRMAEEEQTDIHLFITDVVMPEMNGREMAERLLAIRPRMKHLFMSGYTADVIAHQGVLEEGVNFIHKPFSVKDLAVKIRAVLA